MISTAILVSISSLGQKVHSAPRKQLCEESGLSEKTLISILTRLRKMKLWNDDRGGLGGKTDQISHGYGNFPPLLMDGTSTTVDATSPVKQKKGSERDGKGQSIGDVHRDQNGHETANRPSQ